MKIRDVMSLGLVLIGTSAGAQNPGTGPFPQEQIDKGAGIYSTYCTPCHGPQMDYPGGSFDLRTFPPQQYDRFANSVTKGKNNMPPWTDVLQPGDLEALWAYVVAGESMK